MKPDQTLLESPSVNFKIQIYSPGTEDCLLYEEDHLGVNMTGSQGLFALPVGKGSRDTGNFEDSSTLTQILNNAGGSFSPTTCAAVGTYSPLATDNRKLRLTFDDGSGPVTLSQDLNIQSVPYAQYADSVGGVSAAEILTVNGGTDLNQSSLETIFATAADTTALRSLLDGNSTDYMVAAPASSVGFNNQRVTDVAAPAAGTDAANKTYVDSNLGGNTVNTGILGSGDTGEVLTWNGSQWEAQTLAVSGDLFNGGNTTGTAVNVGTNDAFNLVLETNNTPAMTIDASQGVSLAAGLGVTGGVNAGDDVNLLTESELRFQDAAGGEFIGFKAPASVTTNTTFTLPDGDGTANQVLATDGSGQLIWVTDANTDAVETVFGRSGTVTAATGDYDANQVDNTPAGDIAATDVQAAITELDSEKVTLSGDTMTGNLNLGAQSELRLQDDTGGQYVGLKAPVGVTNYVMELPPTVGVTGQVLELDGSGNLIWASNAPGLTSLNGENSGVQTFATGTAGTDFGIATSGGVHTFNIPTASGTNRGALSSSDWTTFNNKLSSALTDGQILVGDSGNAAVGVALSGDATMTNAGVVTVSKLQNRDVSATLPGDTQVLKWNNGSTTWEPGADLVLTETQVDAFANNNGYAASTDVVAKAGDTMTGDLNLDNESEIQLSEADGNGANYVGLKAPANLAADVIWTLPDTLGAANQVLRNSAVPGVLEWATPTTGTGDLLANGSVPMTGNLNIAGQSIIGGTVASANLTLDSTSNATKGDVLINASGGNVGIGTTAPVNLLSLSQGAISIDTNGNGNWVGISERNEGLSLTSSTNADTNTDLFIDNLGNVGIGTLNPSSPLEVAGIIRSTSGGIAFPDGTTMTTAASNSVGTTSDGDVNIAADDDGNGSGELILSTNTQERFRIANGGNIGIGSSAPSQLLDLLGTGQTSIQMRQDAAGAETWRFSAGTTALRTIMDGNDQMRFDQNGDKIIYDETGATTNLIIKNDGNVGIGTTSPETKLQVGASDSTVRVRVENIDSDGTGNNFPGIENYNYMGTSNFFGYPVVNMRNSRGSKVSAEALQSGDKLGAIEFEGVYNTSDQDHLGALIIGTAAENYSASAGGTDLTFRTTSIGATVPSEKMKISAEGNVGIGTTVPAGKLSVTGGSIAMDNDGDGNVSSIAERSNGLSLSSFGNADLNSHMFINPTGLVGIGTLSPTAQLDVVGVIKSSSGGFTFPDGTTMTTAASPSVGVTNITDVNIAADTDTNGSGSVNISAGGNERIRVVSDGRVGIGTTNPVSTLNIYEDSGAIGIQGGLTIENDGNGDSLVQFLLTGGQRWVAGIDNSDSDKLKISSSLDLSTDTRFTIDPSTGNVGVGTTTPGAKLHVDGSGAGAGVCVTSDGTCSAVPAGGEISAEVVLNTGADYAEYFEAEENLPEGDLVGLNLSTGKVRSYEPGDQLLGVVSTDPGVIGNSELRDAETAVLVALVGQVPVLEERVREDDGIVFTNDGQAIGYRLSNGNIYLNLSSGSESLKRKIASQDQRLEKQDADNLAQEAKISAQAEEITSLKRFNLEFQKRLEKLENLLQK